jgi:GNAT superfamily N-acetyltransferase
MSMSAALELIAAIEHHSARAWPAPVTIPMNGWEMRFAAHSSSRRVNSLNPVAPEAGKFQGVLKSYLAECVKRNSKAHVRLLPLARDNEQKFLSSLGLEAVGATAVEVIENFSSGERDDRVVLSSHVTDDWLDAYIGAHGYAPEERAAVKSILETVPYAMGFAHVIEHGVPVAAGRTAIIDGLAGFNQIATAPYQRRKGHARRIMSALMDYAVGQGARQGYLQVEMRNLPARTLYGSLGFKSLYLYDYWPVPTSINS